MKRTPPAAVVDAAEDGLASSSCPFWRALKTTAVAAGLAVGATATANAAISLRTPPLGNHLGGAFNRYPARRGDIAYTVAGTGSPVLLLHGLFTGNSMAEWANNFAALAQRHTVYAFDFLGWGLSDKLAERYAPTDFVEQVQFFVEDVIGEPCAVIASNQSGVYALEAAQRAPHVFSKFVLVCPASSDDLSEELRPQSELMYTALRVPVLGTALYNAFASRRRLEEFAWHYLYFDKAHITESLMTRYHVTAHQPGAQYAQLSLWAGLLDVDYRAAWSQLQAPALLVWGRNTLLNGLETAPEWLAFQPDARLEVFDEAMLLPHVEHPQKFNDLVLRWLES